MTLPAARHLAALGVRGRHDRAGNLPHAGAGSTAPQQILDTFAGMQPFPKRLGARHEFAMLVEQIVDNPMLNGEVIRLRRRRPFPSRDERARGAVLFLPLIGRGGASPVS